tara:strand:+ start:1218 stop:1745 length:528 start_codon:yes stop_codon:yes gene_type:complete
MACDITKGRLEPCKDSVGGLNAIYFVNFGDLGDITYDVTNTDVIDAIAGTPNAYKYDIKGTSTFTQNIQSDRATGTTAFEQVLEVTLKKLSVSDHKELKLLAYGRPHVIVEDYNGNYFLGGLEHGCDVTGGTIVTGGAMNEMSGYTLTLTGMERVPANFLGDTPTAVGFTVVAGS